MAIDTAAERKSALGQRFGRLPFGRRFAQPIPDGTIDAGDRATLGFVYGGITAVLVIPSICFDLPARPVRFDLRKR